MVSYVSATRSRFGDAKNIQEQTKNLFTIWQDNYSEFTHTDDCAYKMIDAQIDSVKDEIISSISGLR